MLRTGQQQILARAKEYKNPFIRSTDMPEEELKAYMAIIIECLNSQDKIEEKDYDTVAKLLGKRLDLKTDSKWNIIVGTSFAISFTQKTKNFLQFYHRTLWFIVWRTNE